MRIITWNCNMAYRKKAGLILQYQPDIVIVPECEHPDKLMFQAGTPRPTDTLWFGKNQNKGLGIFSYSHFRLAVHKDHDTRLETIVPIKVTAGELDFNLFAIWANNPTDPDGQYVEQVWKALHHYNHLLRKKATILAGDFNSNRIWDRKSRVGNHSDVVALLEKKGIFSVYHVHHKQNQGGETHPTFYLYRHQDKPYHLDYCFASKDLLDKLNTVEIGDFNEWTKYSDHVPLIVSFDK